LAAAKWGALALTLSVMAIATMLVMDVVAYQCGGQLACTGDTVWLAPLAWGDLPENPAHRLVVGAAVLVGVLGVFSVLSFTSRARYEAIEPPVNSTGASSVPETATSSAAHLPGGLLARDFWSGSKAHARLTRVHLSAGLAAVTVTLVVSASRLDTQDVTGLHSGLREAGLVLAGVSLLLGIAILATDDTPGIGRAQWPSVVTLILGFLGLVVSAVAAWRQVPPDASRAATAEFAQTVTASFTLSFNVVWVAIGLLLVPLLVTSVVGRPRWPSDDRDGIGWIPPFAALAFSIIVANVVLLSLLVFVAQRLSGDGSVAYGAAQAVPEGIDPTQSHSMVLPTMVRLATAYFVWAILALVVGFVVVLTTSLFLAGRGRRLTAFLASPSGRDYVAEASRYRHHGTEHGPRAWDYTACLPEKPADKLPTAWTRRRARREFLARSSGYVSALVNSMAAVAVLAVLAVWVQIFLFHGQLPDVAVDRAVTIIVLIPPGLAVFIAMSWRNLTQRRVIGTLWDVGTFWPRSFHPFAPPCYAERAVPELTRRIWWLNDQGGEVLVAAHSQGSIVAAATALRHDLEVRNRPRFGLVTFGSPLRKLYGRAFPAYWPQDTIAAIRDDHTSLIVDELWSNVYYATDYIGGSVDVEGVDQRLPDPQSSVYVYGQPKPPVVSHTGYASDVRFRAIVDGMCDDVEASTSQEALAAPERRAVSGVHRTVHLMQWVGRTIVRLTPFR
jgi:hypothetical protein